jgi:hypothetical protein
MIRKARRKTTASESHFGIAGHPKPTTLHGEDGEEQDEHRQQAGDVSEEVALRARTEEPDPHAEEAREQHEVREEGEVEDVGAAPADQPELDEEHQEAEEHEANGRGRVGRAAALVVRVLGLDHPEQDASSGPKADVAPRAPGAIGDDGRRRGPDA